MMTKKQNKSFYLSNRYNKKIEYKPYNQKIINHIYVYDNSIVFYSKFTNTPVDEIKNIQNSSEKEIFENIEFRLNKINN